MQAEDICLECGLCCNGVIFADVTLQGEEVLRLGALGMMGLVRMRGRKEGSDKISAASSQLVKLRQPCAAFDGCRCRIYSQRPNYCRQFECLLLKDLKAGQIEVDNARRLIGLARRKVQQVKTLLEKLGDTTEQKPLRARFGNISSKLAELDLDEEAREVYRRLTIVMHQLNRLLSDRFYR